MDNDTMETNDHMHSGKLTDLSIFEKSYGKRVHHLAEPSFLSGMFSKADLEKERDEQDEDSECTGESDLYSLKVSLEMGCWLYKLNRSSMEKHKVRVVGNDNG